MIIDLVYLTKFDWDMGHSSIYVYGGGPEYPVGVKKIPPNGIGEVPFRKILISLYRVFSLVMGDNLKGARNNLYINSSQ